MKTAIIFPGQGAQYVGMGKSLYAGFQEVKTILSKVDEILGYNLSEVCFTGPVDKLKDTATQQLAILSVSLAAYEAFSKGKQISAAYLCGLSLGEYSCLYAAGVLSLEDVVVLVRARGKAMQQASLDNPSTMFAVIGKDLEAVAEMTKEVEFYPANINTSTQIVVSLRKQNTDTVKSVLQDIGAKVVELGVSGGFHSPFMESAKIKLAEVMQGLNFNDAKVPIISNFKATPATDKDEIRNNLLEQLTSPVLWKDCVDCMAQSGVKTCYEIGPSQVLRGLMRKINPAIKVINIEKAEDLDKL